jgi:hypothetical protein
MNGKAYRPTLRRGGKFEVWLRAPIATFLKKSFFAIRVSGAHFTTIEMDALIFYILQ